MDRNRKSTWQRKSYTSGVKLWRSAPQAGIGGSSPTQALNKRSGMSSLKYTAELAEEICKLVENGVPNRDAAIASGISEATFYKWQQETIPDTENPDKRIPNPEYHPEFSEALKKSESIRKKNFILAIANAAVHTWQAAAWYLERVYRDEFARKDRVEHRELTHVLTADDALRLIHREKVEDDTEKSDDGATVPKLTEGGQ